MIFYSEIKREILIYEYDPFYGYSYYDKKGEIFVGTEVYDKYGILTFIGKL